MFGKNDKIIKPRTASALVHDETPAKVRPSLLLFMPSDPTTNLHCGRIVASNATKWCCWSVASLLSFGHYVSQDFLCLLGWSAHSRLCHCESNPLRPRLEFLRSTFMQIYNTRFSEKPATQLTALLLPVLMSAFQAVTLINIAMLVPLSQS